MSISVLDRKILWGLSCDRCAYPNCKQKLIETGINRTNPTVTGEECHILPKKMNGPRCNSEKPKKKKRNSYSNLILLCRNHHKIIDDDRNKNKFTVEYLKKMKQDHELWVDEQELFDKSKFYRELDALRCFHELEEDWNKYPILEATAILFQPKVSKENLHRILGWVQDNRIKLNSGYIDNEFHSIKILVENYDKIAKDIQIVLQLILRKRYGVTLDINTKISFENEVYNNVIRESKLNDKFLSEWNQMLLWDLFLELVRASNELIRDIRKNLYPRFYRKSKFIIIHPIHMIRPKYESRNLRSIVYKNLTTFESKRTENRYNSYMIMHNRL